MILPHHWIKLTKVWPNCNWVFPVWLQKGFIHAGHPWTTKFIPRQRNILPIRFFPEHCPSYPYIPMCMHANASCDTWQHFIRWKIPNGFPQSPQTVFSFKSVSCESGYWKFEKWKVKWKFGSLISRSEKWNKNLVHPFREWKVKWKCLDIEIESEKWNENVSNQDWEWKVNCFFRFYKLKFCSNLQHPPGQLMVLWLSPFHIVPAKVSHISLVSCCCINAAFVCLHWLSRLILPLIC